MNSTQLEQYKQFSSNFLNSGSERDAIQWMSWLRQNGFFELGIKVGQSLYSAFNYNFTFMTELSICYYYSNQIEKSFEITMKIMTFKLTETQSKSTFFNAHFCIPHLKHKFISYPHDKIKTITPNPNGIITFTMTTCKRFNLFQSTLNSFIQCCLDLDLIQRWICVDDNSSLEDRDQMKQLYPFFEFIWKTPSEKGHAKSMNIICDLVKTPYTFHMEDDWTFFHSDYYLSHCIEILNQNETYGQCLINRNYAETSDDISIQGGLYKECSTGLRYIEHVYNVKPTTDSINCEYWPHYSLRPGLSRTSIFKTIGPFSVNASHFEMDYAKRYNQHGFKTVFLEHIYTLHTGRLTSQRHDTTKDNAYTLNEEPQFETKPDLKIKTWVINLERRPDRLEQFVNLNRCDKFEFERYNAVDGNKLKTTRALEQLFNPNDYNYRSGIIGCALSHLDLWTRILNDKEYKQYDYFIILEDDVECANNFKIKCENMIVDLNQSNSEWRVIFLGHHAYETPENEFHKFDCDKIPTYERWNSTQSLSRSKGGTGGYILNRNGALELIVFIQKHGMINAIDTMMQHACDVMPIYYCVPHLIYSDCVSRTSDNIDSDIQYNYNSLRRPIDIRVKEEIEYYKSIGLNVVFMNFDGNFDKNCVYFINGVEISDSLKNGFNYYIGEDLLIHVPRQCLEVNPHPIKYYRLLSNGVIHMREFRLE